MEINLYTVLWQTINFFLLMFILRRFLFKPVLKTLDDRKQKVDETLAVAEQEKQSAADLKAHYEEQVQANKLESERIVREARLTGEQLQKELVAEGKAQAAKLLLQAREQIEQDKQKALGELLREVAGYSVDLAGRVVRRTIDQTTHDKLIEEVIAEVGETEWKI
jgi:F-type H+-transporting ATPase subunit b